MRMNKNINNYVLELVVRLKKEKIGMLEVKRRLGIK